MTTATDAEFTFINAEDAPLGVQLYPTRSPEYAPNFTLREVSTVRGPYGTRVIWTYESGTTRTFDRGEEVACKLSK